ncbi:hypothetical protein CSOJ01_07023 [Colletotrichum sojae]|uniref:Uncharacterized protein n=1 Tax=Colletotrichum sojae TaxID=2175907 RepID=A0A8H6MUZ9_9PEZI|nr:hypothetical protein CSOJ01_07023 [Colletotrichum sojae]
MDDLYHYGFSASEATVRGFTAVNARKRSSTPQTSDTIGPSSKRQALDESFDTGDFVDDHICPGLYDSSFTVPGNPAPAEDALSQTDLNWTSSSFLSYLETPETPQSVLFQSADTTKDASEYAELLWMSQFVDLDQGSDSGFVLSNDGGAGSPSLSSPQAEKPPCDSGPGHSEETAPVEDDYSLDGSDEMEMAQMMDALVEKAAPPSEAPNTDGDSKSADGQEPHTPQEPVHRSDRTDPGDIAAEPDLLDEDVDWDLVTASMGNSTTTPAVTCDAEPTTPAAALSPYSTPIVRHPFPANIRDRSVVVGLSTTVLMRTCFRVGELLNTYAKCAREKQDVVMELFARVTYSCRESAARTQHFQLRDLYTDRQPFLSGVFKDWKSGGSIDEQTKALTGHGGKDKLCRCVCKMADDKKTATGRSAQILSIRETTWDEIHEALRILSRDAGSENGVREDVASSAT